jgi:hypothetical protein
MNANAYVGSTSVEQTVQLRTAMVVAWIKSVRLKSHLQSIKNIRVHLRSFAFSFYKTMPNTAHILFIAIELHIPHAHSLKEKRKHVKSLRDRLRAKFNASVAEIDALDDWQRSIIGVTMIGNDRRYLEGQSSNMETLLTEYRDIQLIHIEKQWL